MCACLHCRGHRQVRGLLEVRSISRGLRADLRVRLRLRARARARVRVRVRVRVRLRLRARARVRRRARVGVWVGVRGSFLLQRPEQQRRAPV